MTWLLLLFLPMAAVASPQLPLSQHQSIVDAHRTLMDAGWRPAPDQEPFPDERHWSGVTLKSLSTCAGPGRASVGSIISTKGRRFRW